MSSFKDGTDGHTNTHDHPSYHSHLNNTLGVFITSGFRSVKHLLTCWFVAFVKIIKQTLLAPLWSWSILCVILSFVLVLVYAAVYSYSYQIHWKWNWCWALLYYFRLRSNHQFYYVYFLYFFVFFFMFNRHSPPRTRDHSYIWPCHARICPKQSHHQLHQMVAWRAYVLYHPNTDSSFHILTLDLLIDILITG